MPFGVSCFASDRVNDNDGALCCRVIHHASRPPKRYSGRGVDDAATLLHVMKRKFCDCEHLHDVAAECALDIVQVDLFEVLAHDLRRGIIYEDVNLAELIDVLFDGALVGFVVHEIAGHKEAFSALVCNHLLRLLRAFLLLGKVDDGNARTLSRKKQRNGPSNTGTVTPDVSQMSNCMCATGSNATYSPPVMKALQPSSLFAARYSWS